jgi:hypothetical protein
MDYAKLDAHLSAALTSDEEERVYSVFIALEGVPGDPERRLLESLGIHAEALSSSLLTSALNAKAIERLSELPWVRYIELSSQSKPSQIDGLL